MLRIAFLLLLLLPQDSDFKELIRQLSDERIDVRERAHQKLADLGPARVAELKAALAESEDGEVQARLKSILKSFTGRMVTEGQAPSLSIDGALLAFHRWVQDPDALNMRGDPVFRSDIWIREIATGKERLLKEDDAIRGWAASGRLMLRGGGLVDVATGKPAERTAVLPAELAVKNVRWNPAGDLLVYHPDAGLYQSNPQLKPPAPITKTLHLVDVAGKVRSLELNHAINSDSRGILSWSPDGKRLAFHLYFFRKGNLPIRRIGIVEVGTGAVTYVADGSSYHSNDYGAAAPEMWDAQGRRLAFVTGRGQGDSEVFVANADGTGMSRLTDDGLRKWDPALDPAGRRIAYRAARWGAEEGALEDECIKILDMFTGVEETIRGEPGEQGAGQCWSADGTRLLYGMGDRILEARFVAPTAVAPDAKPIVRGPGTRKAEVLKALASGKSAQVEWAAGASAEMVRDDEVVGALRKALKEHIGNTYPGRALIAALVALDAREASPEILEACGDARGLQCPAIHAAARLKLTGTEELLDKVLKAEQGKRPAVCAALGLLSFGRQAAWDSLKSLATAPDADARWHVVTGMRGIRDPKAMDLLIGLVADRGRHHIDIGYADGVVQVGDEAEEQLASLTGQTFGRDTAKWKAWWDEQKRVMPDPVNPNPALRKLAADREERRAKYRSR